MDYRELYRKALEATENSYAPYSGFHVGAAVLTEDGRVYTGCNIENASYPVSICGERVALSKAVSEGNRKFTAIAIAALKDGREEPASPCGMCRQFIMEFGKDIDVVFLPEAGQDIATVKISQLLTWGFSL